MSKNVTIQGASYSDVPGILLPQTGGGTAYFADPSGVTATPADVLAGKAFLDSSGVLQNGTGGVYGHYGAMNLIKIADLGAVTYNLGTDTTFDANKTNTATKSIKATANYGTFTATSLDLYEYYIIWKCKTSFAYASGTTLAAAPVTEINLLMQTVGRRTASMTQIVNQQHTTNTNLTAVGIPLLIYYNTSGTLTYTWSTTYGVYFTTATPTISSTTATSPTVTARRPTISVRINDAYFSESMAAAVDQANSTCIISCEVYRGDIGGPIKTLTEEAVAWVNT